MEADEQRDVLLRFMKDQQEITAWSIQATKEQMDELYKEMKEASGFKAKTIYLGELERLARKVEYFTGMIAKTVSIRHFITNGFSEYEG